MTTLTRRDLARFGGGALMLALGAGRAWANGASQHEAALAALDPELRESARAMLAQGGMDWSEAGLRQMRASGNPPAAPWLPDVPVETRSIPVGGGHPDVTLFVINARPGASRPAILHTHGGGFILGSARGEVAYEQALARALDCTIVTVDYRLAPETRFSGSVEDNYAALRWLHGQAGALGVDPARIVAMGESAGGGHAALLAIAARDRGEVPLAGQLLVYPMLDDRTGSTIHLPAQIGAVLWTPQANRLGWRSFLGAEPGSADVPAAGVPARIASLAGLPPTYIAVGGADLFVREDIDYARRLVEAGVPTELLVLPGAYHAFDRMAPATRIARRFDEAKMTALRRMLGIEGRG